MAWAVMQIQMVTAPAVQKQYVDDKLIDHLKKLEKMVATTKSEKTKPSYMREIRLTIKDLAVVRGVIDSIKKGHGDTNVQILLPDLKRGQGTKVVAQQDGKAEAVEINGPDQS